MNFLRNLPKDKDLARIWQERQTLENALKKQLAETLKFSVVF